MTLTIALPRASRADDLVDTFAAFHEALRDVVAWLPAMVDARGSANPHDARWLRAFLQGPLLWHLDDEQRVLATWLELRPRWPEANTARAAEGREAVAARAGELVHVIGPLCAGDSVQCWRYAAAAQAFAGAVDDALLFEDEVELPSARTLLGSDERAAMARAIILSDEGRPWSAVTDLDAPLVHIVHAVRTRRADGDDDVRSFARCPRRAAVSLEGCRSCPHLDGLTLQPNGGGTVSCAIDDAAAPGFACVGDVMTRDVVCIAADASVADAVRVLASSCVGGLPVLDPLGRAVGMLSESDVLDVVAQRGDVTGLAVSEVMTAPAIVVREGDSVDQAARVLVAGDFHRVPVVSGSGLVVGVVSTLDLLRERVVVAS